MSEASRAWSWRHAFASSDLAATTKAVLHTLGMFMNELGEGCYPSVADICRYSGLDKKTVMKHLAIAREAGWLTVSQHGYRGQKWKRNEYAARWPERDLVAPNPPFDDDREEGGGAVPPPSAAIKAVELRVEGGGTEGSKVVEEVHQDKTSPETTPDTTPEERARERETEDDPRKLERRVKQLAEKAHWPNWGSSSTAWTVKQFAALSEDDRRAAEAAGAAYVQHLGRKALSMGTYFVERKWLDLPAKLLDPPPPPVVAPPFGKMWGAQRTAWLTCGPGPLPKASSYIAGIIAQGGEAGERERLRHQATHGWPLVKRMDEMADNRRGWMLTEHDERLEALASSFVQVRVGSDEWNAWQAEYARRGWPWLPDPGLQDWVYFPAGGPEGLNQFTAALEGHEDHVADRPHAAE